MFASPKQLLQLIPSVLFVFFATVQQSRINAFEFVPLGDLPGGGIASIPRDISGDGRVVVGESSSSNSAPFSNSNEAFRWTRETGIVALGDFSGGDFDSSANAISIDGSIIVGFGTREDRPYAVRWTEEEGMVSVDDSSLFAEARGVSDDGSVIIGHPGRRWTEATGAVRLPPPVPCCLDGPTAYDLSGDGSWTVGEDTQLGGSIIPLRWLGTDIPEVLVDQSDSRFSETRARGISQDGSVVVGWRIVSARGDLEAYRWTESTGAVLLGLPDGFPNDGTVSSVANGISPDGSTIVGYANGDRVGQKGGFRDHAAIWTEVKEWQLVEDILTANGIDLAGWQLTEAVAASRDGSIIAGEGINPAGFPEGWLAVIVPEPSACATLSLGMWILSTFAVRHRSR